MRPGVAFSALLVLCAPGCGESRRARAGEAASRSEDPMASRAARSGLLAAMLLHPAAPTGLQVDAATKEFFEAVDVDGNGLVSKKEYRDYLEPKHTVDQALTDSIFAQADIDDDGNLQLREFEFSRYIDFHTVHDKELADLGDALPPGLLEAIEAAIASCRDNEQGGHVHIQDIASVMAPAFDLAGFRTAGEARYILALLFDQADVIRDSVLNLNELDYFHYLARDILSGFASSLGSVEQGR